MSNLLQIFMAGLVVIGGTLTKPIPPKPQTIAQGTAIIRNILLSFPPAPTSTAPVATSTFGHLPVIHLRKIPTTKKAATFTAIAVTAHASTQARAPVSKPVSTPALTTAASLLNATTISFQESLGGPYNVVFTTNAGAGNTLTWNLGNTTIGGTGGIPKFSVSSSCDPPPDEGLLFKVSTSYDCTVSLTPLSGAEQATQSKDFSFTTGAGQLIVTPPSSMGTVLSQNVNSGGFVFNNENAASTTITEVTVNVSYTALDVQEGPVILRFVDPATGLSLLDYHMENLALDPTTPYTHTGTDITFPLSFPVKALDQKLLPIELLGVHQMNISGVNPIVTVTLTNVVADPGVKTILNSARISWSCIFATNAYDPNATSGAIASEDACQ